MTEQRLNDIEIHLMHQEKAIQDLNEVVILQQQQIDDLASEVTLLRETLHGFGPSAVKAPDEEPPPPHY